MNLVEQQWIKKNAVKYLVSKGYVLKQHLISRDQAPKQFIRSITTKKVFEFILFDRSGKIVDKLYAEYNAIASDWENFLTELCRYNNF